MIAIESLELQKDFRVFERREGVVGAVRDLFQRRHRTLRAVDRVSFSIEAGERVGYIGPNGAGKSTTLKMLTGILVPTAGSARVVGLDPLRDRDRALRRLGAVFGQRSQLWWDLAPIESYRLLGSVYGLARAEVDRRLAELETVLELGLTLRTPVRKLSLGQKMRCELAAALLHSPDVLFLDEPTIGLDLVAKEGIRRFLLEENARRGTTLILTTHDLADIEELCERVIVIDRGRVLFDGKLGLLKRRFAEGEAMVFHVAPTGRPDLTEFESLTRDRGARWQEDEDGGLRVTFDPERTGRAEIIRRVIERSTVVDISFVEPRIEDVIRRLYRESGAGQTGEEETR